MGALASKSFRELPVYLLWVRRTTIRSLVIGSLLLAGHSPLQAQPANSSDAVVTLLTELGGRWRYPTEPANAPITRINLAGCQKINREVLEKLATLPELRRISLRRTNVKDSDLAALHAFPKLASLDVGETVISAAGIGELKGIRRLETLSLAKTGVTDHDLAALKDLINLESLELYGTSITGAGFEHIKHLQKLRGLQLDNTAVDDAGLARLGGLKNLEQLHLQESRISDAGLATLSNLDQLVILNVSGTQVTDKCIGSLEKLDNLKTLDIRHTKITAAGAERLVKRFTLIGDSRQVTEPVQKETRPPAAEPLAQDLIKSWARDLGSPQFAQREEASRRLLAAGREAVPVLTQAAESADGETRSRALGILEAIAKSNDFQTKRAAISALRGLLTSEKALVRKEVAALLERRSQQLRAAAVAEFQACRAPMRLTPSGDLVELKIPHAPDRETALKRLAYLECFPELERLSVATETSVELAHLEGLNELRELTLSISNLDPDHLAELPSLPKLEQLTIPSARRLNDAALARLPPLPRLASLELFFAAITDRGLESLSRFPNLRSLRLTASPITSQGLAALVPCDNLQSLTIRSARIDDGGFRHLAEMDELISLTLSGNLKITGSGLAQLKPIADRLTELDLSHTQLTDEGLEHLAAFRKLQVLKLNHAHITNSGLKHLASLSMLTELHLSETAITDEGVAHLAPLKMLAVVDLSHTGVSDASLQYFGGRQRLTLRVGGTKVTNDGLEQLAKLVPRLQSTPERKSLAATPAVPPEDPFAPRPGRQ